MKAKLALAVFLVAVLALVGVGCGGTGKVTGGGWFTNTANGDTFGNRITFGFNAQYNVEDDTFKGQFQLNDHDAKTNIHGEFDSMPITGIWGGVCTIKGESVVSGDILDFYVIFLDAGEPGPSLGDTIAVYIGEWPMSWVYQYNGALEGGNIKGHTK